MYFPMYPNDPVTTYIKIAYYRLTMRSGLCGELKLMVKALIDNQILIFKKAHPTHSLNRLVSNFRKFVF